VRRLVTAPSGARVDTEAVFDAARAVGNHAEAHAGAGAEATTSWFRVADGYSAPETQQLLGSMEPVRTASESFSTAAQAVARALTTFAIEAEAAEARRARAATSIASFRTVAKGDDSWQQDPVMVAQNSVLTSEVAAAEQELCEAEEACARAIASIPVDAPAFDTSTATVPGSVPAGTGGWGYPDEVFDVVLNPFFFWGMKPEEVTAWWNTVPAEAQAIFIASFPALIGNRDGIPAKVRDEANRSQLAELRTALMSDKARIEGALEGVSEFILIEKGIWSFDSRKILVKNPDWDRLVLEGDRVRSKILALDALEEVIDRPGPVRLLLHADFQGPSAKAAVAVGDPDVADHVGVLVGGTGTTVAGGIRNFDRDAEKLLAKSREQVTSPDEGVSIVAWLSYDAPGELTDATSRSYASVGAPLLARFTRGLDATNIYSGGGGEGPHVTVMAHSYGAVVGGDGAAIKGSMIDDLVVYGAPGIGDGGADGVGKYSMLAPDDPIILYQGTLAHGRELGDVPHDRWVATPPVPPLTGYVDPAPLGWKQLPVVDPLGPKDGWSAGSSGHSQYLLDQSLSQFNLANILTGNAGKVS